MPAEYVVLPDVGRITREQLRSLGVSAGSPEAARGPSRRERQVVRLRASASTGALHASAAAASALSGASGGPRSVARRWLGAHVASDLSVGGSAIRSESAADFSALTSGAGRAERAERDMREALRLPPALFRANPVSRPASVQLRAEGLTASVATGHGLGIRRLEHASQTSVPHPAPSAARGSGVAAVRREARGEARSEARSEVQLPDLRPSGEALARRAELRQRLEEQEQLLQQQLAEQAELQWQLQQHLEQEQQLQRELREQLERELQDFHLEHLEAEAAPDGEALDDPGEAAGEATQTRDASVPSAGVVEVPGVGSMQRQQLANLEALLNGEDLAGEDLPDLSHLSSAQLERLEAELSRGLTQPSRDPGQIEAEASPPPPEEESNSEPSGDPQLLSHQAATPSRQPPVLPREGFRGTFAWRIQEASLAALQVKVVPEAECSICCELLSVKEVLALPCQARGCGSHFHMECIRPWLERNPSCPLCRDTLPQLVRPVTPRNTGHPLLDLWFLAMAMQRQERETFMARRQPGFAGLQGVVFTASALVELLSMRLFDEEGRGEEDGPNLDLSLAMFASGFGARGTPAPLASEALPPSSGTPPVLRPSFQEQILRSAAAFDPALHDRPQG